MNSVKFRMENFSFKVLKKVKYLFFALKMDKFKNIDTFLGTSHFPKFCKDRIQKPSIETDVTVM